MLWLIFQHLTNLKSFIPSNVALLRNPDIHGRAAQKLLELTPICCTEAKSSLQNGLSSSTGQSGSSSLPTFLIGFNRPQEGLAVETASEAVPEANGYQSYLIDANKAVRDRFEATRCWQYNYDGVINKSNNANETPNPNCDTSFQSGYSSPNGSGPVSMTSEENRDFWNIMK